MGSLLTRFLSLFNPRKPTKLLMLGLDNAGKTTITQRLKLGKFIKTIPTIGFNVENIDHKNLRMMVWDIAGQEKVRPLWKVYFEKTNGLIFVVDSEDKERIGQARDELNWILSDKDL
mmetsp:Transcript_4437/g.3667  ORF Transcript_4437/g.3667 Transcript_4437/m.3667 type:complete len:117 (+) Transcript_4437:85-435(+)